MDLLVKSLFAKLKAFTHIRFIKITDNYINFRLDFKYIHLVLRHMIARQGPASKHEFGKDSLKLFFRLDYT